MTVKQNTAFVFPGQGSQAVGMLSDLVSANPQVMDTFTQASEVLGYDVWALIQEGPQDKLNMTEVTQPVLLTCSVAIWRLFSEKSEWRPAYFAGHSLGEWAALVCADVIAFEDAVKLVQLRGRYMQEAVPAGVGAMAAIIGMADDKVESVCEQASSAGVVAAVNYNSPGQLVIAGELAAVELAAKLAKEGGAKMAKMLPVSAPFHTSLMKPAADKLALEIDKVEFSAPSIPVLHNVGVSVELEPAAIKGRVIAQIYSPVPWVATVEKLQELGVDTLVECGAGKVLTGLNKRINKQLTLLGTDQDDSLNALI